MDLMKEYTFGGTDPVLAFGYANNVNPVGTYAFDYAAAAGNEDASINTLTVGDLVYVTGDKVKKIKISTTNATLLATEFGVVEYIKNDDGQFKDSVTFTADGGEVGVVFGKNIPWFGDKVYIHNENTSSTDTRDLFVFATHAGSSAVLEGLVAPSGKSGGRQTYIFK